MKITTSYLRNLIRESIEEVVSSGEQTPAQEQQSYNGNVKELHDAIDALASVIKVLRNFSGSNEYGIDVASNYVKEAQKIEMFLSDAIDSMEG